MAKRMTLPDKPSELITVALRDLRIVERNPAYRVEMWRWHRPAGAACEVCMAGAVMACTGKAKINDSVHPEDYNKKTMHKLFAIDSFRQGDICNGLTWLGVALPKNMPERWKVAGYGKAEFYIDLRNLIKLFRIFGL